VSLPWKVARDPYLRALALRHGLPAVEEAGFFEDGDPGNAPLDDTGWLSTPTELVRRALARGQPGDGPPVVLLATGAFHPVHDGHLAMMETARRALGDRGRRVVGGYLSPAHDDYIRHKWGRVDRAVSDRLARLAAVLAPTGWLSVDPWEALARRVAVNYTDVTARLQAYLGSLLDPAVEVVYVAGGDNARFALAFSEVGGCVVVGRPGSEETVRRWREDPRLVGNPRIVWAAGDHPGSSTALRPLPAEPPTPGPPALTLRLEDVRAVATLGLPGSAWRAFQEALLAELRARTALTSVPIEDQGEPPRAGTISLDPLLPGQVDLALSRLYDLGGHHLLGHVARPDHPPLEDQLAAVPPGDWILRDDDRATGATVALVTTGLPPGVTVTGTVFSLPEGPGEIADSRDFLLGTDDGGLVLALPDGTVGRAPYLLPAVDPAARAEIPPDRALAFSRAVWELNAEVFARTGLTVSDLPPPAGRTARVAGFAPGDLLEDLARHHTQVLAGLLQPPGG
jgi:nicotinic acid mononucleotide adenylyltransferase